MLYTLPPVYNPLKIIQTASILNIVIINMKYVVLILQETGKYVLQIQSLSM